MIRSTLNTVKHMFRHDWEYFPMSWEFIKAFPEMANVGRFCRHCRRLEYLSDDKRRWNIGAWGELRRTVT